MANLVEWIKELAGKEKVEAVVIGELGWSGYGSEQVPNYTAMPKGKVLSWRQAKKFLDYEFDDGFGAPGCNAIYVWTTNKVIGISQYDGSTTPFSIPRNPTDVMPDMPGG